MSLQPFTFFEAHMNSTIVRWIRRASALLLVVGLQGTPALAQGDARFRGTVRDASGASVPGATVIIRNEKTGDERTTQVLVGASHEGDA